MTFPLILSGWLLGLLNNFGLMTDSGFEGGIGAALAGTVMGFLLLFPILAIGGMGEGDVKMQMGFGSWVGALYGATEGAWVTVAAVCCGMIVGGVIAVAMMLLRGDLHRNAKNFREIINDFAGGHESVRIRALVVKARQAALKVGREQAQRIPPLAPPRIGDVAALEHDVIDRPVGEKPARGEAGVAGPDDHRGDALDGSRALTRLRR